MKLFVWNINQRSSGSEVPELVSREILNDLHSYPDIVVLTEFLHAANANDEKIKKFKDRISEKYYTFCNEERDKEREKANGILIAVKKEFGRNSNITILSKVERMETDRREDYQPNFLQLNIEVNGEPISIIGTRIRVDSNKSDYKQRHEQLLSLIDHINALENKKIIIAGDLNNARICGAEKADYSTVRESYRDKDTFDTYNYHIMKDGFAKFGMAVSTPKEKYSYGFNLDGYKPDGFLKLDHIITTENIKVNNPKYYHNFIENYKVDVEWILDKGKYAITPPFPDHAILTADVDI